ncbi:MAG: zinc ribbon domain-containing protein [Pseudoclavibacter sp.]
MKASPENQRRLLDLAELDARRARLQHRANTMPEQQQLKGMEQARVEHRAWVARATGEVEDARSELKRVQDDTVLVEQRLERDRDRQTNSSSMKDVQGLESEIETLLRRRSLLEDSQLETMQKVEEAEQELERATSAQSAVELQAEDVVTKRDAARADLQAEAKVVSGARRTLVADLPADLLKLYEEQRERYGVGAAELVGQVTTGSNVTLDATDVARILAAAPDEVVLCPDSNAILVRTERSASAAAATRADGV